MSSDVFANVSVPLSLFTFLIIYKLNMLVSYFNFTLLPDLFVLFASPLSK
jgi:hypothetical protein